MNSINTMSQITATKQAVKVRDSRGRFTFGNVPKTGFHTNPERRSNGSWKKERTMRGKLEALLDVTVDELLEQIENNRIDNLEKKLGDVAVSERLRNIFRIEDDGKVKVISKEFDKLMLFIYGRKVDYGENIKPSDDKVILTEYIIPAINPSHIAALSHTNSSDYN